MTIKTPSGLTLSEAEKETKRQQALLDKSLPKSGEVFATDAGEGSFNYWQRQGDQFMQIGSNAEMWAQLPRDASGNIDWQGVTIGEHRNRYSNKLLDPLEKVGIGITPAENKSGSYTIYPEAIKNAGLNLGGGGSISSADALAYYQGLSSPTGGGGGITTSPTDQNLSQGTSSSAFKNDLSPTQVQSIVDLTKNKPVSEWNDIDKANWNYATNNAPLPTNQNAFATLSNQAGDKKVVFVGSEEANNLFKNNWTLGDTFDDTIISSNTMTQEPDINIGDTTTPTTYTAETLAGGFNATISAANAEIKRLQQLSIAEPPETADSKLLESYIASLDPDSLTGKGAAQLSEEEKRGIEEKTQALIGKTAELKQKSDEINALTQSYNLANQAEEGRPQTLSRLKGQQAQNYKMYLAQKNMLTADAGFIQSDLLAMQNQLQASQDAANRAVDLMYSDREAKYNAIIAKINILAPQVEGDEARYLAQIQLDLQSQQAKLAEAKANQKDVQNLKINYIEAMLKAGQEPDRGVLSSFSKAQSVDQAIDILGRNLPQKSDASDVLSPTEAATLGVPYGTTEAEAAAMNITPARWKGTGGGRGGTTKGGIQKSDIKLIETGLISQIGDDGFLNPSDYNLAKQDWIQAGGEPDDFDKKFKGRRNPDNPYYEVTGETFAKNENDIKEYKDQDYTEQEVIDAGYDEDTVKKVFKENKVEEDKKWWQFWK